jgi:hypothetical protein
LRVGRVGKFQKYQFTLGERISSECAILSFADSGEMSRRATDVMVSGPTVCEDESRTVDCSGDSSDDSEEGSSIRTDGDGVVGAPFNIEGVDITILLSRENDLSGEDRVVLMHCDSGFSVVVLCQVFQ